MNIAQMNDSELAAAVFEKWQGGIPDYKHNEAGGITFLTYEHLLVDGDDIEVEVERGTFNPCHEYTDILPLLLEEKISLVYSNSLGWVADRYAKWVDGAEWNIVGFGCHNPLRAASLAYLLVKEI